VRVPAAAAPAEICAGHLALVALAVALEASGLLAVTASAVSLLSDLLLESSSVLLQSLVYRSLSLRLTRGCIETSHTVTTTAVLSRSKAIAIQLETARLLTAATERTHRLGSCCDCTAQAGEGLAQPQTHSAVKMAIVAGAFGAWIGGVGPQGFEGTWTMRAVENSRRKDQQCGRRLRDGNSNRLRGQNVRQGLL